MIKRISILLLFCLGIAASAQKPTFFENDVLGIAFAAETTWQSVENNSDGTLELVNRNHNLELRMIYECTDLPVDAYLDEVMKREGMNGDGEHFTTQIDQHDALGVVACYCEMRHPVKVLLIAVKNGDGYYLLRFKCPDECFRDHKYRMQQLIGSIILKNNRESSIFYAEKSRNS